MALDGLPKYISMSLCALLPTKNSIKLVLHLNWTLVTNPWYFSGVDPRVTPSVLPRKQRTQAYHEHHLYVIFACVEMRRTILVI
jgi:hypothetical protein